MPMISQKRNNLFCQQESHLCHPSHGLHMLSKLLQLLLTINGASGTSLHHTHSQPVIGTRETSYQHRDATRSQLDDTHNDLPTEPPTRNMSAVRHRHMSINGSVPNLPDERLVRGACRLVKTNRIVRITQVNIKVVIDPVHRRTHDKVVHSLLAHDMGAIVR
ncbi:hypothetical protein DVH24_019559 [Malus domestica]|uniref:Uncharacterized protein n=1 Tax=Malus domestica TaxID=3750 RepID=A0A498I5C3_MALDO|nr:hypothetical protein DVH24_019559 [Malus domestica]